MRAELMGHEHIETTRGYTHIRPTTQIAPLERLSEGLPIADLVVAPRTRGGAVVMANFGGRTAGVQTSAQRPGALGDTLEATSEDTPKTFGKSHQRA